MLWLMALLLFGQDPVESPQEPVWQFPTASEIARCGRRAGGQASYDVVLTCTIDDDGRPVDCDPQRGRTAPTPRTLNAARCMARSYRLTNPEARDADGRVTLRIVAFPG